MSNSTKLPSNIRNYISPHRVHKNEKPSSGIPSMINIGIVAKMEYINCKIRGKIIIESEIGPIIKYIKCCTPDGSTIFVDTESDNLLADEQDISYVMTRVDNNLIPHSKKYGDYKLCFSDVDGVVFENIDYFVVIVPDDNTNPIEKTYRLKIDTNERNNMEFRPKSYPLVKSSNLLSNPESIFESCSLSFSRLVSMENKYCRDDLSNVIKNVTSMLDILKCVNTDYHEIVNGYNKDNVLLEQGLIKLINKVKNLDRGSGNSSRRLELEGKIRGIEYNLSFRKDCLKDLYNMMSIIEIINERMEPLMETSRCLKRQLTSFRDSVGKDESEEVI